LKNEHKIPEVDIIGAARVRRFEQGPSVALAFLCFAY